MKKIRDVHLRHPHWKAELVEVNFDQIEPNSRNANKMDKRTFQGLIEEVRKDGALLSVPWVRSDQDGKLICGDGQHRLEAALKAGVKEGLVFVIRGISEKAANAKSIGFNKRVGEPDPEKLKDQLDWLKSEETELDFDPDFDIEKLTGYDEREIEKILEERDPADKDPEAEITEELLESHNYLVLYFDNEADWMVAQEKFGIQPKAALWTDGKSRIGIGRVIKGSEILERIHD